MDDTYSSTSAGISRYRRTMQNPSTRNPSTRTASPLRRAVAATAALTMLAGGGMAAMQHEPTATTTRDDRVQLTQNVDLQLPELTVGTPFRLDGNKLIADIKAQAGYPNARVTVNNITGLPPGITWDKKTNVIQGTPTRAGTYTVSLSARGCIVIACTDLDESAPITVKPGNKPVDPIPTTIPSSTPFPSPTPSPTPTPTPTPTTSPKPTSPKPAPNPGSTGGDSGSLQLDSLGGDTGSLPGNVGSLAAVGSLALAGGAAWLALNGGLPR